MLIIQVFIKLINVVVFLVILTIVKIVHCFPRISSTQNPLFKMSTTTITDYSSSYEKHIAVLWDVDGTLSNSYQLGFSSTNQVLENHGKSRISEDEYHEGTKYTTPRRLAWHVTGDPDHQIGIQLGEEFDELYVELVSIETAPLYPGIGEVLQAIKQRYPHCTFGALSNACTAYVEAVLRVNELQSDFAVAFGADDVPKAKPHPDGLWKICEKLQLSPSNCIYVGDSPTDGQAATAAGMKSIGVTWGSLSTEKVIPHFTKTIHVVEDLFPTILSLFQENSSM